MAHTKKVARELAPPSKRLRVRQGRIVLPVQLRRAVGLEDGDELVASVEGGRIVLSTDADIDDRIWSLVRGVGGDLVEELRRERRAEAKREAKQG